MIMDQADRVLAESFNWSYATSGYAVTRAANQLLYCHRAVAQAPEGVQVDHVNGDTLDNRRRNLRWATASQQMANAAKKATVKGRPVTSKFKGVARNGRGWMTLCGPAGTVRYCGTYSTEEEAAEVYNRRAVELWGQYARLNKLP